MTTVYRLGNQRMADEFHAWRAGMVVTDNPPLTLAELHAATRRETRRAQRIADLRRELLKSEVINVSVNEAGAAAVPPPAMHVPPPPPPPASGRRLGDGLTYATVTGPDSLHVELHGTAEMVGGQLIALGQRLQGSARPVLRARPTAGTAATPAPIGPPTVGALAMRLAKEIGLICRCLRCCCDAGRGHNHPRYAEYLELVYAHGVGHMQPGPAQHLG